MRSRSWSETAALVLGAAVEGVWCGALAAALTGASWAALTLFATAVILGGALVARRLERGGTVGRVAASGGVGDRVAASGGPGAGVAASGGDRTVRAARLLAVGLIVCAAGLLLVAGQAWAHPSLLWQTARDGVFAGGLVAVGLQLGRAVQAPDVAVRRAVRAFALLCAILVTAALAGSEPGWAAAAVVVSLAAGGLLVAVARYDDLTGLVAPAEQMPAWPWLLAVAGAVLAVVAAGALLSLVFQVGGVLWVLHALGAVVRYALDGVGYAIAYAGVLLARAGSWVLGLLHVRPWHAKWVPPLTPKPALPSLTRNGSGYRFPGVAKLIGTIAVAVLVIAGLLVVIVLSLRRIRHTSSAESSVVEEREELSSLRSAAGHFAGRLGRGLRRRVGGLFGREPDTPAERVRRRYEELERRLTRAGQPRPLGATVREYLADVSETPEGADPSAMPAGTGPAARPQPSQPAADLAVIYELARYSARAVESVQAERFASLALTLEKRG